MPKYLIDVNLPYYFSIWNTSDYIHQRDIDDSWTDEQIWDYAKVNNLTIITKDSDFSHKIIFKQPPPKVIHIKIGNMKLKDFLNTLSLIWENVLKLSENYKLVNVFIDYLEGVN
jgi:predicted nuclease of predicted toxin-antitoxin system